MQAMSVAGTTNGLSQRWHLRHEFITSMDDAWAGVMLFLLLLPSMDDDDDDDDDGGDIFFPGGGSRTMRTDSDPNCRLNWR